MRTGQIIFYNQTTQTGVIRDTNDQEIVFFGADTKFSPVKGSMVLFEIDFRNQSLAAIKIEILTQRDSTVIMP